MHFVSGFSGFDEAQQKDFETRYGTSIEKDERLAKMRARESFMLNVVIPRHRTFGDAFKDWSKRSKRPEIAGSVAFIFTVYVSTVAGCSLFGAEGGICEGGPVDANGNARAYLSFTEDYGPPILNALATLMLSFYANTCLGLYKDAYEACQTLKDSVVELMMIAAGTIHPRSDDMQTSRRGIRMEFWRCVNLFHVCTYVLADKTRNSYNFDNFLVPVATAFGDWDGNQKLGMLKREELSMLVRSHQVHNPAATGEGDHHQQLAGAALNNSRGDVRSRTAALHSALGVRLFALTDYVLEHNLSNAAWPAWCALIKQLLNASEKMKQRALFRLPRIYRYSVRYLIGSAIVTDTFILGARAGRLLQHSFDAPDWRPFAWFGASMLLVINLVAAYFVLLLVQGLSNMEQPFDQDLNSMPGLSYVCAAAEMSLRTVACQPAGSAPARRGSAELASEDNDEEHRPLNIMSLLQVLDEEEFLQDASEVKPAREPTMAPRVRRRKQSVPGLETPSRGESLEDLTSALPAARDASSMGTVSFQNAPLVV